MSWERFGIAIAVGAAVGVVVGVLGSLALKAAGYDGNAEPWLIPVTVGITTGILAGLLPRRSEDGEPR